MDMTHHLTRPVTALTVFLLAHFSAHAAPLTFQQAVDAALSRSAGLMARQAGVQAATALQVSAPQLPDPRLTLGLDSLPINGPARWSLTRDDFTARRINWEQEVPNAAKRAARTDFARARSDQELAQLQAERLSVRRESGLAWLAAAAAQRRLRLQDELLEQQAVMRASAADQLAFGRMTPVEVNLVEQSTLELQDRRDELRRGWEQALASLHRWVGATPPLADDLPLLPVSAPRLRAELAQAPELAAYDAMQAMAEAEVREAEAAGQGDWGWSVGYAKRGPAYADFISAQLSVEMPLSPQERQQPRIRAKQLDRQRLGAEREDRLRQLRQELDSMLAEHEELQRRLQRLEQHTLPQTGQHVAYALAGFEAGREKLGAVIDARKQRIDALQRQAELEFRRMAIAWRLNTLLTETRP